MLCFGVLACPAAGCSDDGASNTSNDTPTGNDTISTTTSSASGPTTSGLAASTATTGGTASTSPSATSMGGASVSVTGGGGPTSAGTSAITDSSVTSSSAASSGGAGGASSTTSTGPGGTDTSTTSSQTSSGGTGGGGAYQPCPTNGDACLILPFGDSITNGVGSSDQGGYRAPLFELAVEAGRKITFIGSQSSGPNQVAGEQFPKNHEGHSGWTIDSGYVSFGEGISTLIPEPAFDTIPHIVLLMIGTNDVSADHGTDTIADRLEVLLDSIAATAPDALIVVAIPTPIGWNPAALDTYSARIPQIVEERVAQGEHMLVADMSGLPASGLGSDDLHPNDQGYDYMASVWYAAIESVLPE